MNKTRTGAGRRNPEKRMFSMNSTIARSLLFTCIALPMVIAIAGCGNSAESDDAAAPDPDRTKEVSVEAPPNGQPDAIGGDAAAAETDAPDGTSILRRHIEVAGGSESLRGSDSRTVTYDVHFHVPGAAEQRIDEPTGTIVTMRKAPNLLRTRTLVSGVGEMHGGYDGEIGWALEGVNARLLREGALTEIRREAIFDREIHLDLAYPTAELMGEIERDGVKCWHVRLVAEDGARAFAFFEQETGLLFELARQLQSPTGAMAVLQRFTDWTDHGGRLVPGHIETRMGPSIQTMRLVEVDDTPLDAADFAPPAAVRALVEADLLGDSDLSGEFDPSGDPPLSQQP